MEVEEVTRLAVLRAVIGFLGEKAQAGWWPSSFFAAESRAFLGPVFPRTQILAQYQGVSAAAASVHDERIGVGDVFHLFRLPEDMEQKLHRYLQQEGKSAVAEHTASAERALACLREIAAGESREGVGPVRVGSLRDLRDDSSWRQAAAYYAAGLSHRAEVYPYFANKQ